ncbi:CS012 protein, partial [Sterrhoptilus dennistouni]|nr:CS012 protein [Sterrhoptilus dennistouni]
MPIRDEDVMALLSHPDLVKDLKAAIKYSHRGALVTGASALVGGLLVGPAGFFIGGALGGFIGWMTSGQFKSVPQIFMELSSAEKQKLRAEIEVIVKDLYWTDAPQLICLVLENPAIRGQVVAVLARYLS